MRYLFLVLVLVVPFAKTMAQDTYTVDFTDPNSVVNALFHAARTMNYSVLQSLCDPLGESDGDCRQICALPELAQRANDPKANELATGFVQAFETAHVEGEIRYHKTDAGEFAEVMFEFNQGNPKRNHETLRLVKRGGNWYLLSF